MELTQLRYFLEVAKIQHVTKAAEELHVAQPAITQAIHRLENELEVPLFTSKGRNIVLTTYGKYFYENLSPLLSDLFELPNQLHSLAKLENSTIHLNVLAASSLVTEAIIEYQKIDDSLHIQLNQNEDSDLYDICITTRLFYQQPLVNHDSIFVCTEKIYLAVPNNERFSNKESINLAEVSKENFISLSGAKQFRCICDKYCQNAGIKPNIIFESDSPAAVKNMIAANMGIGFWPAFSWEKIDSDKVKLLNIENPVCSRDLLITYKKNKTDNSKAEHFFNFLTKYIDLAAKGEL